MKKITLISLSILSLLCCCMMLSGCELLYEYGILCRHEYTITETPATCTSPKIQVNTCVNCGKTYQHEVGQKLPHTEIPVEGYPPTCSSSGLTDGAKCDVCGKELRWQDPIPADPTLHSPVTVPGYPATCTKEGLTDGSKCQVCSAVLEEQITIPYSHNTVVTKQAVLPTCTENGYTEERTCTVCNEVVSKSVEVVAKGHAKVESVTQRPTCTVEGVVSRITCSACGLVLSDQPTAIPALGHTDQGSDDICDTCGALFGSDVIEISTLMELKQIVNDMDGKYRLVSDITIEGAWLPIGTENDPFNGYLDGNGHTISGVGMKSVEYGGLFLYNNGTIANLTVDSLSITVTNRSITFGGIAAFNSGTIIGCSLEGNSVLSFEAIQRISGSAIKAGDVICGGLVGINSGTVKNCVVSGAFHCEYVNHAVQTVDSKWGSALDSVEVTINLYFGGVAAKNNGLIESCTVTQTNHHDIHVMAEVENNDGTAKAYTNAYIGNLVGENTATINLCQTTLSTFTKFVGSTQGTIANGVVCSLNQDTTSVYFGAVGKNSGTIEKMILL